MKAAFIETAWGERNAFLRVRALAWNLEGPNRERTERKPPSEARANPEHPEISETLKRQCVYGEISEALKRQRVW